MLQYNNIKIVKVDTRDHYYDEKKKKSIKFKKPLTTEKIIHEEKYCLDLGDLYETVKFHTEKNLYSKIKVSFDTDIEY